MKSKNEVAIKQMEQAQNNLGWSDPRFQLSKKRGRVENLSSLNAQIARRRLEQAQNAARRDGRDADERFSGSQVRWEIEQLASDLKLVNLFLSLVEDGELSSAFFDSRCLWGLGELANELVELRQRLHKASGLDCANAREVWGRREELQSKENAEMSKSLAKLVGGN